MSTKSDFQPQSRLRPLRLTPRDVRVIRLVAELGIATVRQVTLLEFGEANRSRAQTRLHVSRQAGYLDVVPGRAPNEPAVYVVSRRGRRHLDVEVGPSEPVRRTSHARLHHDLAINDCRVQIIRSAREPGIDLLRWATEAELRPITLSHGLLPDAFFQLARRAGEASPKSSYFLEVEISEKSEAALRQKLTNLGAYYYGGRFERDFGTRALRVLVLVKPEPGASINRLVRRITSLATQVGVTFVRVAPLDAFLSLPPAELFVRPIWRQPSIDGLVPLFPGGEQIGNPEQTAA